MVNRLHAGLPNSYSLQSHSVVKKYLPAHGTHVPCTFGYVRVEFQVQSSGHLPHLFCNRCHFHYQPYLIFWVNWSVPHLQTAVLIKKMYIWPISWSRLWIWNNLSNVHSHTQKLKFLLCAIDRMIPLYPDYLLCPFNISSFSNVYRAPCKWWKMIRVPKNMRSCIT